MDSLRSLIERLRGAASLPKGVNLTAPSEYLPCSESQESLPPRSGSDIRVNMAQPCNKLNLVFNETGESAPLMFFQVTRSSWD
jgi:hypothetical protein